MQHCWYLDIPPGHYTTNEIIELSKPRQRYHTVHAVLRRLKVSSFRPSKTSKKKGSPPNEKIWIWEGIDAYNKLETKEMRKKR